MPKHVYTRIASAKGEVEIKPPNKYDRTQKPKPEKPPEPEKVEPNRSYRKVEEGGTGIPVVTPEEQKKTIGPGAAYQIADKDDLPDSLNDVYILKSNTLVNGHAIEQVVGAYTKEALNNFLTSKGFILGPKGFVFPMYSVQKVEVQKSEGTDKV